MAKKVVLGWGRFNPPTIGHSKVVDSIKRIASSTKADAMLYLSHTENSTTDPVPYTQKIQFATKAFGRLVKQSSASNITQILQELEKQGYTNVILVVGQDRIREFDTFLHKYNGIDYHFSHLKIVSAGMRDPDAEGATGMSGSKMREYATNGDFQNFSKGVPPRLRGRDVANLYNVVRKGLNLAVPGSEASAKALETEEKQPMKLPFQKIPQVGKLNAAMDKVHVKMLDMDIHPNKNINETFEYLESPEYKRDEALKKKATKYGIDVAIIHEVFHRGLTEYYRVKPNTLTEEQYAFNRVNSFLEGGSACKEDNDLLKKVALAEAMRGVYQKEPKSWKQVRKFGADLDTAIEKFLKTNKELSDRMDRLQKTKKETKNYGLHDDHAGEWGTDKLRKTYSKDTPGQTEDLNQMFDKYSVKQPQDVMERRDNIDWILSLISRQSHPKEFAGALKRFLSLLARDKGRKHTAGAAIAKAAQEFGLQPRQLQDFIDKLVKKGKLPASLVAEYMPKENK
jgi:nicotinic acid mononucleotide adenylyltransferase